MDSRKNGNLAKLVAFFLIVTVLIMAIALSASGWQGDDKNEPDSGDKPTGENADENTDGEIPDSEEPKAPEYTHYISGLEISKEESLLRPLCILYDTEAPMYGLSSAFLTVELPTEGGKTRLLAFTNSATSIGKLGTLAPSRKYIANVAAYFAAIPVYIGEDDSFGYNGITSDVGAINFALTPGYYYTEYGMHCYTNADLLSACISSSGISSVMSDTPKAPYIFAESAEAVRGGIKAETALIQFDKGSTTELIYSKNGKYKLQKNAVAITDKLSDTAAEYDNAFILFADSTTHETADSTEMILDTVGGGNGYYLNGGLAKKISWAATDEGELCFYSEDGTTLEIAPGTSYMAFAKSSYSSLTKLS